MTTMRSTEPPTGTDEFVVWLFPFLGGTEPQPGEHGIDRHGFIYVWHPDRGWQLKPSQPTVEHEAEAGG